MADLLRNGQAWLASQLKTHASTQVIYQRGADQVTVSATVGRTLLKLDDGYGGIRMEWTDRDFLIQSADLNFGGGPIEPAAGDLIKETVGATQTTYEVASFGSDPPFRPSDPFAIVLRIHTKLVATEGV